MVYRCAKHFRGKVVLEDVSPAVSDDYIKEHCREYVEISPDSVVIRDTLVSLSGPMLAGLETNGKKLLIPFLKRCSGYVLIEIPATKKDLAIFRSLCSNCPLKD
ncbi:MAG TPA: DUF1894 domain-containing protein [Methanoregulaceae archaeon]|nr:DUF1894 domain-containing protein [Methanoregulaceae archaeon]